MGRAQQQQQQQQQWRHHYPKQQQRQQQQQQQRQQQADNMNKAQQLSLRVNNSQCGELSKGSHIVPSSERGSTHLYKPQL